jgi:hypothetical protein
VNQTYARLHRWARKTLTAHQLGRVSARAVAGVPWLGYRLGTATRSIAYSRAADIVHAENDYDEAFRLDGPAAAFLDDYAAELGPLWHEGVFRLVARLGVYGVRRGEILMASGQLLRRSPRALLDTESGTPNVEKQMPAIHRHRLRLAGPVLTLVRTPRGSGHYYHFIAERFRFVLHALRTCPELRGATVVVRPRPNAYQRAAYEYLARTYPQLVFREVPADVRVICEELVCVGRRDAHKVSHFAGRDDFEEIAHAYRAVYGLERARPTRRIYLSRAGVRLRRTENEDEIVAMLAARGFEAVRPETLSHADQVRLFGEAAQVVATGGAGLTNLLFAPPGATVVETSPPQLQFPFFIGLALQMGLRYGHVYGGPPGPHELYRLDPKALAATLDALQG